MVAMLDPGIRAGASARLSYLTGRFLTEHLIRVHAAFEGDLTAALVLGTIGQRYIQRFYDECARDSPAGLDRLVDDGAHVSRVRACNALSVSAATGIPRETVRRKVQWLEKKGWITVGPRGQLALVPGMSSSFEEFDLEDDRALPHGVAGFPAACRSSGVGAPSRTRSRLTLTEQVLQPEQAIERLARAQADPDRVSAELGEHGGLQRDRAAVMSSSCCCRAAGRAAWSRRSSSAR
ncbi:MAG: hypothetical protein MZW92_78560 [Comamonadaceae bacterium]|nr:hypothetical protein [Comamonadaceae bacterium]